MKRDSVHTSKVTIMCQFCNFGSSDNNTTTVYGTDEADLLVGGSLTDYIFAEGGNDSLFGHGGDDFISGKEGNDSILGGGGNDYLVGDSLVVEDPINSNDTIRGGAGNDELIGRIGQDELFGGHDNDQLFGEEDDDKLHGGRGEDYLDGDEGNDKLFGNAGNDTLWGGNGVFSGEDRDTLLGGDGNDILVGGIDNDILNGGNGEDRFEFVDSKSFAEANLGVDRIQDFGNGDDKIILDGRVFLGLNDEVNEDTPLDSNKFAVVSNNAAVAARDELIVYSSGSGKLFYNENGNDSGFGEGGQFAILSEQPDLVAQDFIVT